MGQSGRELAAGRGQTTDNPPPLGSGASACLPVSMPFFSPGSCQLTFSEVSRMSLKLRCPTGPGTVPKSVPHPPVPIRVRTWPPSARWLLCSRMLRDVPRAWVGGWVEPRPMTPTVLMGAHQLGAASGPISRRGEAQHRCEVLCEFFQAGHEAHVDAVLKVGPGSHHGNLLFLGWLPGNQLRRNQKNVLEKVKLPPIG